MELVTLLSFLFGNEETVKLRRQLVLLREKMEFISDSLSGFSMICSGSLGEGVAYPRSDDDLMYVEKEESSHVYGSYEEAIKHNAYFFMVPSEYSLGFYRILYTRFMGYVSLSSRGIREEYSQFVPFFYSHGPCLSTTIGPFEYDFALSYSCPQWPAIANEWIIRRRRNGWPSQELVENIVRSGCHVVPIGNPDSPLSDYEWRLSFSLAERSLIHAFNHVQFIVYCMLKLILKRVINKLVPDVLCSYFLKTVLFYAIENTNPSFWVNDTISECYTECLLLLYRFIDRRNCPNYFVPDNNMMKRKVNESNRLPLLGIVRELITRGIEGSLFLCDEEPIVKLHRSISPADSEFKNDGTLLNGYLFRAFLTRYVCFIHKQYKNEDFSRNASRILSPLLKSDQAETSNSNSSLINLVFKNIFTLMGLQSITISPDVTEKNTSRYMMLKRGQAMLRMGRNSDVSSGRLHLANYLFKAGKFRQCLAITQTVLSKFAPYVVHRPIYDAAAEKYLEVICNKGYSLEYKARNAWASDIKFTVEYIEFAPLPVKLLFTLMEQNPIRKCCVREFSLHPLCFAYLLQGLCFHQVGDFDSMDISVTLLENSVKDLPRHEAGNIIYGRFLLACMKMIQMDYHSSCRCITSIYFMKKDIKYDYEIQDSEYASTCVILLACLLNRIIS